MAVTALERRPATWEEYLALGEDVRAEYLGGCIIMTPNPTDEHQVISSRLWAILDAAVPPGHRAIQGWGWRLREGKQPVPDLMVHPITKDYPPEYFSGTPDLCVEILSTNRTDDTVVKATEYAAAGLPYYWIIDPAGPELHAFRLSGDTYRLDQIGVAGTTVTLDFGLTAIDLDVARLDG